MMSCCRKRVRKFAKRSFGFRKEILGTIRRVVEEASMRALTGDKNLYVTLFIHATGGGRVSVYRGRLEHHIRFK